MNRIGWAPFIVICVSWITTSSVATVADAFSLPKTATTKTNRVSPHFTARLLVDPSEANPRVGVLFDLASGWHLYWKNPGETGLAPELDFDLGEGRAGELRWPVPEQFSGIASYGYGEQVLLASPVANYAAVDAIAVDAHVLICADQCIPVDFQLDRPRPRAGEVTADERAFFDRYEARVPKAPSAVGIGLAAHYSRSALRPGDAFEGAIAIEGSEPLAAGDPASFYPYEASGEAVTLVVDDAIPHPDDPSVSLLRFHGRVESDLDVPLARLGGVLDIHGRSGTAQAVRVDLPFPGAAKGARQAVVALPWSASQAGAGAGATSPDDLSLLRVVLLALLGGLILNGMPCVLPVLGIKICSAAELAQHDRRELRRHGFAYLGGVLASMAVLACVVVSLKAAGTSVGWGFQFQEPLFVAVVAAVVVLFALNLFGVYEINLGTSRLAQVGVEAQGTTRSFFDGLLAVVLATPCTAPFLGTAVGFAFSAGTLSIFAVFLAIGTGLASPYVAVCLVPGWARFVPRAGSWMLRLRAGLGFLLLATAVWLVWIFGRSAGADAQAALLAVLVAISFGVWLIGWLQSRGRLLPVLVGAAGLLVVAGLALNQIDVIPHTGESAARAHDAGWNAYDPAAIRSALAAERPVFVSFTADWCLTCKLNERRVLESEQVREALHGGGFATFRGDWTRRDEAIRRELARHGRAGVPLYLVYDPRDPDAPAVLPELLNVDLVLDALEAARPTGSAPVQTVARNRETISGPY